MATILLCTLGSAGDVHPVFATALALKYRGHRPVVMTSDAFESAAHRLGLEFETLLPAHAFESAARDPDIWHPWRGFGVLVRHVIVPAMKPLYERIEAWAARETDLAVASSLLCMGARLAHEKLGVPMASLHVQPVVMRSRVDEIGTPHFRYPRRGPRWQRDLTYWMADALIGDPELLPELNGYRASLGLPRVRRVLDGWVHSPQRIVGLWPSWYAPVQPDWPAHVSLTDFPLFDPGQDESLDPALQSWLDRGDPPVLFTAGSANLHTDELFARAARVCRDLRARALLVGPQEPRDLAATDAVRHVHFAPFGRLLPQCGAIVHHGGIGTTSRALLERLPQVVLPHSHDQPDNALRVAHLGAGEFIPAQRVDDESLRKALKTQLARRDLLPRFEAGDGAGHASDAILSCLSA